MKQPLLYRVLLTGLFVFILMVTPVLGDPPSEIILSYDSVSSALKVTITHQVRNPAAHYIDKVNVSIDGVGVLNMQYTSQPTNDTFTYTYPLTASEGSTIAVQGACNLGGDLTRTLLVGNVTTMPTTTIPPTTTQAPGFTVWMGMGGLLIVAYVLHFRRRIRL